MWRPLVCVWEEWIWMDMYGWTREWTRGKINAQPTDGRVASAAWKFYVAFKRILHSMLTEFLLERI